MENIFSKTGNIEMFIDEKNNIVIFPSSKDGITNYPIELFYPYSVEELANTIEKAVNEYDKHPHYIVYRNGRKVRKILVEIYYNQTGFQNASKGKRLVDLGWNSVWGNYVNLMMPCKGRAESYDGIEKIELPPSAYFKDYAEGVIKLINLDLKTHSVFKAYKRHLNW